MPAGNVADLAFALQPEKGAAALASQYRTYHTGGGVAPMRDINDIEETTGSRLRNAAYVSQTRAEGSPQMVVRPNFLGLLLYGGMGAKAVAGGSDPYTHTFTLFESLPWLTVWRMLASGLNEKFTDCKVVGLHFNSEAGGLLQVTADILGLAPSYLDAHEDTASVETTNAFIHADGEGALQIEGDPVASIETFSLDIVNNGALQQGDAVTGYDITEGMLDITWSSRLALLDFELWNRYHYGTANPADGATPTRDILELGAGGLNYKFTRPGSPERSLAFSADRVQVQDIGGIEPNANGDPLKYEVTYKVYEPATGSGLTAVLKNNVAEYPAAAAAGS
jgi:hypothetical protein